MSVLSGARPVGAHPSDSNERQDQHEPSAARRLRRRGYPPDVHVAAVIDEIGTLLATKSFPTSPLGSKACTGG